MNTLLSWAPLAARILVGGMFVWAGYLKIVGYTAMVAYAGMVLPSPEIAIIIAIVVEILGGLSILLGYKIKWGALALAAFQKARALGIKILPSCPYLAERFLPKHPEFSDMVTAEVV